MERKVKKSIGKPSIEPKLIKKAIKEIQTKKHQTCNSCDELLKALKQLLHSNVCIIRESGFSQEYEKERHKEAMLSASKAIGKAQQNEREAKMVKHMEYLKIDQLKAGYLYKIIARNANYGIWVPQNESFIISRIKFGNNYLFEEHHWDCVAFATVKPLEELEKSPFVEEIKISELEKNGRKYMGYPRSKEILDYLNKFEPRAHFFELLSKEEQDEIRRNRTWEGVY